MTESVRVGIIGDFKSGYRKHESTDKALIEAAAALGIRIEIEWLPTPALSEAVGLGTLDAFGGLFAAPNSPYENLEGGLAAIRHAREHRVPFLATCGGFQHAVLEFARNVVGMETGSWAEYDARADVPVLVPASCSVGDGKYRLSGRMPVRLVPDSGIARMYGAACAVEEEFQCNHVLNRAFQTRLAESGLRFAGFGPDGEACAVEIADHPFFLATAFLPQWNSSRQRPHPLIAAFIRSARLPKPSGFGHNADCLS